MIWVSNVQLVYLNIQVYTVYTIRNQPKLHSIYKRSSYTTKTLQGHDFAPLEVHKELEKRQFDLGTRREPEPRSGDVLGRSFGRA